MKSIPSEAALCLTHITVSQLPVINDSWTAGKSHTRVCTNEHFQCFWFQSVWGHMLVWCSFSKTCLHVSCAGHQHILMHEQVKQNVQRTLASDLQKLSVKFRKQQRTYLNKLRQRDEPQRSGGSLAVLDDGPRLGTEDEYDAGYSESQVPPCHLGNAPFKCWS